MIGILQMAKDQLLADADEAGTYVDFTMGRGRDTLFLCGLAPKGKVYAFDVQADAVTSTRALLDEHGVTNAFLIHDSHERFLRYVSGEISGGLFNLGYLPGGDRTLTTQSDVTLRALRAAMGALKRGGTLGVAVYPGHPEGAREGERIQEYLSGIGKKEFDAFLYRLVNVPDSPYMIVIQKR